MGSQRQAARGTILRPLHSGRGEGFFQFLGRDADAGGGLRDAAFFGLQTQEAAGGFAVAAREGFNDRLAGLHAFDHHGVRGALSA
jgi:hypothetical protein